MLYSTANSVYSLRKLNPYYTGNCIRIRRSNDNAETDIGFVGKDLDTATITNFVGSNDGFVTTWYNQGTDSNDGVQTIALYQPRIVNAGVIETINGKPTVYADGTRLMRAVGTRTFGTVATIIATVMPTFTQGTGVIRMWCATSQTNSNIKLGVNGVVDFYRYMGMTVSPTGTYINGTPTIRSYSAKVGTNGLRPFKDGVAQITATAGGTTANTSQFALFGGDSQNWIGDMSDIVYFTTELSDTNRRIIEADQGTYYSITVV